MGNSLHHRPVLNPGAQRRKALAHHAFGRVHIGLSAGWGALNGAVAFHGVQYLQPPYIGGTLIDRETRTRESNLNGGEDHVRKRNLKHFLTKPRGRLENTNTNMTFSMSRETAARLKDAALARGTDVQGVIELAVDEWLARQMPGALR
ncbi:hypothetical protein [Rhodomicrobium lacus]|uniref:hypothetical protein n=1 Tax=Rhodomicrobium lacus TaxID=2498452 RepID=UPI0026E47CF2|nr:hypothetical protein [Rhodomicrobium lacus]WKW49999.1 hypothetical protein QMO75_11950 [Rhodomicrobium lacus]